MLIRDEVHPSVVGLYYRDHLSYRLHGLLWGAVCHYGLRIQLAADFPNACWLHDARTSLGYVLRYAEDI